MLITNEVDAARLDAACTKVRGNRHLFNHVVHVEPTGVMIGEGSRTRVPRQATEPQQGRRASRPRHQQPPDIIVVVAERAAPLAEIVGVDAGYPSADAAPERTRHRARDGLAQGSPPPRAAIPGGSRRRARHAPPRRHRLRTFEGRRRRRRMLLAWMSRARVAQARRERLVLARQGRREPALGSRHDATT